ncbi:MAG: hypothetical protein A2Z47_11305 [Thermodesulfovibrio sp. RBG_19FT_COMBO_42_12]|nr:MAG: hypothetical protein A2Z47_11305 [Thermodesulfovibrio sp. RBG_19FT_COMBO_42_12]
MENEQEFLISQEKKMKIIKSKVYSTDSHFNGKINRKEKTVRMPLTIRKLFLSSSSLKMALLSLPRLVM